MTRSRPAAALLLAAALLGGCSLTGPLQKGEGAPADENAPANMAAALLADAPEELQLPASFSIPLEVKLNAAQLRSGIEKKDGATIHYFAPENGGETYATVPEKDAARYSRLVLGHTAKGDCVVQGFYAATGRVHTEPFATSAQGCGRFALDTDARYRRWFSYDEEGHFERVVLNDMMPGLVVHNYAYQAGQQVITRIDFSQGARVTHTRQRRAARLGEGGRSEYPEGDILHTEILDVDGASGAETFTRVVHGQSATVTTFAKGELQYHDSAEGDTPATRRTAADAERDEAFAAELLAIRAAIDAARQDIEFFQNDQPLR
ncbi:MAG: hypothetical protein IKH84_01490 [Ottowia sp.]|nr:hypothetical protein [Ottowia sp.]